MEAQIIKTNDGSNTIYLPGLDETYHSKFGAIQEARHVFILNGIARLYKQEIKLFELGFGTGLNALLTAIYAKDKQLKITYITIEKYPLEKPFIEELNFHEYIDHSKELFYKIHHSAWDILTEITPYFSILKIKDDILTNKQPLPSSIDIIYFDAFAPSKQAELWSEEIFKEMHHILNQNGLLVTYSSAGVVKKALRSVGFMVKRLPGPPGKHHMLSAQKN